MARTREHIIETKSRLILANLLPPERFVEREQTERDYGIDVVVECFDGPNADGAYEPSGTHLYIQLKASDDPAPADGVETIPFDLSTKALLRAERFVTPILLVWCPVQEASERLYYEWLQEYMSVALDGENPKWREQKYNRIHIRTENVLVAGDEDALANWRHIADHPKRLADFGQLARLAHEARWAIDDLQKLSPIFQEALGLNSIYGWADWKWGQFQRGKVEQGLRACHLVRDLLSSGKDPTDEEVRSVGWSIQGEEHLTPEIRWQLLYDAAKQNAQLLSTACAIYFDNRMKRIAWGITEEE